jgi:hypothetical protein
MSRPNIQLGDTARDTISGFKGVVVASTTWLNGCLRLTLQPQTMKDGKPADTATFDVEQLELVKAAARPAARPSGGPKPEPSQRSDPRR